MQSLPVKIDQLFIDDLDYYYQSSKRKQELCVTFGRSEPQDNIKTLPNTLAQSSSFVNRFIQYDGLKTNLLECAESSKVSSIIERQKILS